MNYSIVSVVLIITVITAFQFLGRYLYNYRLTEKSVQVVLFGSLPLFSIQYKNIKSAQNVALTETLWPNLFILRFGNRIFGGVVLIKKNNGLVRSILITPDDPEEFTNSICDKLTS